MKKLPLFLPLLFITGISIAQKQHWTPLFKGKNLTGWIQKGGQAHFAVADGVIAGTSAPSESIVNRKSQIVNRKS